MSKKNRVGSVKFYDFKLYYKSIVIKTVWYWHRNRAVEFKRAFRNKAIYGQLIFNKSTKNTQCVKDSLFNKWCWKAGYPHATASFRMKLDSYLTLYAKKSTQNGLKTKT